MTNHLPAQSFAAQLAALPVQSQDEAFTLAYYLLGSEAQAVEIIQQVFARPSARAVRHPEEFRLVILRKVAARCQVLHRQSAQHRVPAGDDPVVRLWQVDGPERTVTVLVDVLGLSYAQAGRVLGCTARQAGKLLAHARLKLMTTALPPH